MKANSIINGLIMIYLKNCTSATSKKMSKTKDKRFPLKTSPKSARTNQDKINKRKELIAQRTCKMKWKNREKP